MMIFKLFWRHFQQKLAKLAQPFVKKANALPDSKKAGCCTPKPLVLSHA
jgi:hypothetical protein